MNCSSSTWINLPNSSSNLDSKLKELLRGPHLEALKVLLLERREGLVKGLVRASKKGEVYEVAGIAGRISELDEILSGNFEGKVGHMIKGSEENG